MNLEERIIRASEEADQYEMTVHAILCFAAYITHDGPRRRAGAEFGVGRRMDVLAPEPPPEEDGDESSPVNTEFVTPDLVAQVFEEYGVACEAKAGMAQGGEVWDAYADQLLSYSRQLRGWWTPTSTIDTSDAILLMHRSRARQFARYLEEAGAEETVPNGALIEFVRSGQVKQFYSFSLEWGRLREPLIERGLLEATAEVPLHTILDSLASLQFYDAEPPLPMMLEIIWGELYSDRNESEFDEKGGFWPVQAHVPTFTRDLQSAYGSGALGAASPPDGRACEFPRRSWVRRALDELVSLELAKPAENPDTYSVFVRQLGSGDLRSEFVRRMWDKRQPAEESVSMQVEKGQTVLPL